jgi:hypothetical protein
MYSPEIAGDADYKGREIGNFVFVKGNFCP